MLMLVIVAAFFVAIAEWLTGDHAEQSRMLYQCAFGVGLSGIAIKVLIPNLCTRDSSVIPKSTWL
jgi:hypothetical protein